MNATIRTFDTLLSSHIHMKVCTPQHLKIRCLPLFIHLLLCFDSEFSHVALVLIDDHRCGRLCRGGLTGCRTAACRLGRGAWLMVLPRICCQPRDRPNFGVDIQIIMIAVEFLRQEFRHFIYSSVSIIDNHNYVK